MRPKTIKVDFFRPVIDAMEAVPFRDLLTMVDSLPDDNGRCVDFPTGPVRLAHLELTDGCYIGEMVRLRVNDPAVLADEHGSLAPVVVQPEQALAGFTCFLYSPRDNILCLERNRTGVGSTNFCRYFQNKGRLEGSVGLELIIQPDVLERIAEMNGYTTLEVGIAPLDPGAELDRREPFVYEASLLADSLQAPQVNIRLSMGHKSGSLSKRGLLNAIRKLFQRVDSGEVKKLRLTGTEGLEDHVVPVDLIAYRVYHEDTIELSHDPTQLYTERRKLLQRAWNQHRHAIRRITGN